MTTCADQAATVIVASAYCVAATTELEVVVDAPAAGDCMVAFDVQHKKAP